MLRESWKTALLIWVRHVHQRASVALTGVDEYSWQAMSDWPAAQNSSSFGKTCSLRSRDSWHAPPSPALGALASAPRAVQDDKMACQAARDFLLLDRAVVKARLARPANVGLPTSRHPLHPITSRPVSAIHPVGSSLPAAPRVARGGTGPSPAVFSPAVLRLPAVKRSHLLLCCVAR